VNNVLKIGGNQLDDPEFIAGTAQAVAGMAETPVIVHGGGKAIKALQEKLGLQPQYVDGLRVTDDATLEVVKMVLIGVSNVALVAALTGRCGGTGLQRRGSRAAARQTTAASAR
jgi:acetylglutamate kinase